MTPEHIQRTCGSPPARVVGVVVLFHPSDGSRAAIEELASQVHRLAVVDNTPGGASGVFDEVIHSCRNLEWITLGKNRGIAYALNRGLEVAEREGAGWMLTLDQDTRIEPGLVAHLLEAAGSYPDPGRVAMVAPALPRDGGSTGVTAIPRAITSGALARVAAVREVGAYREDLFIDYVDFDLCSRLRKARHVVIRCGDVVLQHRIGSPTTRRVLGFPVTTSNHAPIRRYYKIRNRITMVREHFLAEPAWMTRQILSTFWEVTKISFLEQDKLAKLGMMARGLADGLVGRTGSFEQASGRGGPK